MTHEPPPSRAPRTLAGATVLQVVPDLQDARMGQAAFDLAAALLRSGARALVAGGGGPLARELQALGGEWFDMELAAGGFLRRRGQVRKMQEFIAAERVALVHAHGHVAARHAASARPRSVPLVTTYVGAPPAPGWRRAREDAQARGQRVLACSDYAARAIARRYRLAPERIVVIPPGIDTVWFDPAAVEEEHVAAVRQSWRVRPEARIVFAPGRLEPSQGYETLIDAIRALVSGGMRGVVFVLAAEQPADPSYAAALDARIAAQGIGGIIRRVGACDDMPAAYAAADLVVLPLERESLFSLVAAEAQAMGRPVVATALGALPEMLEVPAADAPGPRTGWLVRPNDPLALARALAEALALGPRELDELGARARAFAQANFAREQIAAEILTVYDHLLRDEG